MVASVWVCTDTHTHTCLFHSQVMQTRCHVTSNKGMVPDSVAMVADFELLGEGLVKKVEVISYTPT